MERTGFKRIAPCRYRDLSTGVHLEKSLDNSWTLFFADIDRQAFVTSQWGEFIATFRITGFRTMHDAKSFDFWPLIARSGKPNRNSRGNIVSLPIREMGNVPYTGRFTNSELRYRQGELPFMEVIDE